MEVFQKGKMVQSDWVKGTCLNGIGQKDDGKMENIVGIYMQPKDSSYKCQQIKMITIQKFQQQYYDAAPRDQFSEFTFHF